MNRKFILIIAGFTITVPGFFLFSYWYLGIFSSIEGAPLQPFVARVYAAEHSGDYNKTGEKVVQTRRLLKSYALPCQPVLIYHDNAIVTGKAYLKSSGGCITDEKLPAHVEAALRQNGMNAVSLKIPSGYQFKTYAQTAVALRKVWPEIARLTDKGAVLKFPLVHLVRDDGTNEFLIGTGP